MRIFKFGGASVKDAAGVRNLLEIVKASEEQSMVIVVSAMGKVTNGLEQIAEKAYANQDYTDQLEQLLDFHQKIAIELVDQFPQDLAYWMFQLETSLETKGLSWSQFYDGVIPHGELMSTIIIHQYLKNNMKVEWVDARKYVKTNSQFTEANVDWSITEDLIVRDFPNLLSAGHVITQGFVGSDLTGRPTTLGREGSDYTGAIIAHCLSADSLTVWKDVPGLLNADPRKMSKTELFDELSFQEVSELTYYGAKVIHPKTIRPLAQKNIPLLVKSFIDPTGKGTIISQQKKVSNKTCFVFKEDQLLVTLRVLDNSFIDEKKLARIFQALDNANIKINLMQNSALTFSICIDANTSKLRKMTDLLSQDFQVLYNERLFLATIKDYTPDSFQLLPPMGEIILEQKTRNTYQIVYKDVTP